MSKYDQWTKIPPVKLPACDLCMRAATWRHPAGGMRCDVCTRPKTDRPACTCAAGGGVTALCGHVRECPLSKENS